MSDSKAPFWSTHLEKASSELNVNFCAGRDISTRPMADSELLPFDIWTNQASVIALHKAKVITQEERQKLLEALEKIAGECSAGKRELNPSYEDVHMNVEIWLQEIVGPELAGKIHTGRSRNDQSATDLRLYMREAALLFQEKLIDLAAILLKTAAKYKDTLCPGFSHGQPAMVTTFGHTVLNYSQGLFRDIERFGFFLTQVNRSPLGAAAGFGTSWPLDRKLMADLLGFSQVEINSLDAVGSRWELESLLAYNLVITLNRFSQIANDLYFLGHPYVGLVKLDDSLVTGSSVMPQKKNPDILEVTRAKATIANGYLQALTALGGKNLSGYNRDFQWAKYPLLDLVNECALAPLIIKEVCLTLKVNSQKMKKLAGQDFLNAVEVADLLARKRKLSFREGYKLAGMIVKTSLEKKLISLNLDLIDEILVKEKIKPLTKNEKKLLNDPVAIINNRSTLGAASVPLINDHLTSLKEQLAEAKTRHKRYLQRILSARQKIS